MSDLDFHSLRALRRNHPAWRLLVADHAPLLVSFLHRTFIVPNVRTLSRDELVSKLEDQLFALREQEGPDAFPRSAAQYLDEWASDDHGWLRKYYPAGEDVPHFDLTSGTEKAIEWLASLRQRQFVGTESRLLTVFQLLEDLVAQTQTRPELRIAELERKRAELTAEIERVRQGELDVLDDTQVKDRFQQAATTARGLLSDFREVEENFRSLDRGVRERIATWEGSKAELLEEIFGRRDQINDSDQGRTFRAFWDFLMSPARQERLTELLRAAFALQPVQALAPDRRLLRIHYDWLQAGEVAQRTVARLSEQLRRYLDDQAWLEDRRVMQLIRSLEQHALALRDAAPQGEVIGLDAPSAELELPMDRPLFLPPRRVSLAASVVLEGVSEASTDALHEQVFVDPARLEANLREALRAHPRITLAELIERHPLEHGLAELVAYLRLASEDPRAVADETERESVQWLDPQGTPRRASLSRIVFTR